MHTDLNPTLTYIIPLQQGLLAINGPDAAKFLQGQVTCDVRELAEQKTLLGAQCNIKGRMLLCFRALQTQPEQILLRTHKDVVLNGMNSLGKYSVFFKATLLDASKDYRCVGITGPDANKIIQDVFNLDINENGNWKSAGKHLVIRIESDRFECWLAADEADDVQQKLSAHTTTATPELWTLLNIQAGIGDLTPATLDLFTPQAINFQLVNGINFRKGCYTGQEIVARLHYRGTLKRHMYRFEFDDKAEQFPAPGSLLKNTAGKNLGEVIIAARKNQNTGELLASVVDDGREDLYLADNPQKLRLLSLPYAIPTGNEAE